MDRLIENVIDSDIVKVPDIYWEDLLQIDPARTCSIGSIPIGKSFRISMLGKTYRVDPLQKSLFDATTNEKITDSLLILILLVYLLRAKDLPFDGKWVGVQELKTAHFFRGPHELRIQPLIDRFGENPQLFKKVAQKEGAEFLEMADIAFSISPLSKIRFAYLLWEKEEGVFPPEIKILFDASIEKQIPPDTIWALVGWMTDYLCEKAASIEK